jgi:hypothetical protein
MVVIWATGEYVSKKSSPFCVNLFATNLALYFSIVPLCLNFFLKIHLHPIGLHSFGQSVISQVPFDMIESISLRTTSCQYSTSRDAYTCERVLGTSSQDKQ